MAKATEDHDKEPGHFLSNSGELLEDSLGAAWVHLHFRKITPEQYGRQVKVG